MHLPFTTFNSAQPTSCVANSATGKCARQLSLAWIGLMYLLLMGLTAQAQTTWTGTTSTDWATASNWNTRSVPTATDNVIIPDVARTARV
jgi:hypothetical protein